MFRLAYLQAVISLSGRFRFGFHACAAAGYIFCKRGQMCPPVCEDRLLQDSAAVGINVTVLKPPLYRGTMECFSHLFLFLRAMSQADALASVWQMPLIISTESSIQFSKISIFSEYKIFLVPHPKSMSGVWARNPCKIIALPATTRYSFSGKESCGIQPYMLEYKVLVCHLQRIFKPFPNDR